MGILDGHVRWFDYTDTVVLESGDADHKPESREDHEKRLGALLSDPSPLGADDKQLLTYLLWLLRTSDSQKSKAMLARLSLMVKRRADYTAFMAAVRTATDEMESTSGRRVSAEREIGNKDQASGNDRFNPTGTYVLDDECIEDLEQSRLTGIVRSLSADEIPDIDWADED